MNLNIDSSKEEVANLIQNKFNINEKILSKINDEEIDGEALTLLRKDDYKFLGIKVSDRNKIISIIEKDILKLTDNIRQNNTYKYIHDQDLNNLWNSLDNFISKSKLGEKLKFIKYLLIRDPPPEKQKTDDLSNYLKKIFKKEEIINQIIENLEDLLIFNEEEFEDQCSEWELSKNDIFILKIIVELMKQNNNKLQNIKKEDNATSKDILKEQNEQNTENKINLNSKKEMSEKHNEKIGVSSKIFGLELINTSNSIEDKYVIYSVIKVFNYETSQGEITMGLINPIEEFERICNDFKINFQNECSYIDYNKAKEIKLLSFMLWGSRESLFYFFKNNYIKEAFDFFSEKKKETGIYLCININKKIGYLIIWPGNLEYQYSKLDEPNDNILLTLIRYGFSLSSNSIICLCSYEINKFDFKGYEIFEDIGTSGYDTERRKIVINVIKEKIFKLGDKLMIVDGLKDILNSKKIINGKINQSNVLLFEEKGDGIYSQKNKQKIINFIQLFQRKFIF